jgi:anti-sigma regulatory factor (Ser/Thr protein kinase)
MRTQAEKIRHFILDNISLHSQDIVAVAALEFNVTRTTIHRHLKHLLKQGLILKSGTTRNIKYVSKHTLDRHLSYQINPDLSEFNVLKSDFGDIFKQFPENIEDICVYGFTEIFNNAIEHSKGSEINVITHFDKERLSIHIQDNGIGVFKSIVDFFQLSDPRESFFHLTKGKITTDPTNHTGEGIFFTSRAFDGFEIFANHFHYFRNNQENDWAFETIDAPKVGSIIKMTIHIKSTTGLMALFKRYQDPETLAFNRTEIIVELSRLSDEPFISRSQAKRIIFGLEKFQQITLDFSGVRLVGQGFVDEIFRVFTASHPTIRINTVNANSDVTFMIQRGLATAMENRKDKHKIK